MELFKYFALAFVFANMAVCTSSMGVCAGTPMDYSHWPDAGMLKPRDRMFIMEKFTNQAITRRKIPPPARILKTMITLNRYAAETVTDYNVVYLATERSTCVGKITVTVKAYCGQGVVCTSSQQTVQCFPPGYPCLRV